MKNLKYLLLLLVLISCYKEAPLEVPSMDLTKMFDFPQGNNSYDQEIQDIYQRYGVKLIYKGFNPTILSRTWIAAGTTEREVFAKDLTEDQVKVNLDFMKNQVFAYLPEDLIKGCFTQHIFMCNDAYSYENKRNEYPIRTSFNGADFWINCLEGSVKYEGTTQDSIKFPVTEEEFRTVRGRVLQRIFCLAIKKGKFRVPEEFFDITKGGEMDYKTPIRMSFNDISNNVDLTNIAIKNPVIDDPNLFLARGFSYAHPSQFFTDDEAIYGETDLFKIFYFKIQTSANLSSPERMLWDYICLAMRFSEAEMKAGIKGKTNWSMFPILPERHPRIYKYRRMVIEYMKEEYNIDLEAIYAGTKPNN